MWKARFCSSGWRRRGHRWHQLLGERDLTFAEATRIVGLRIGKPDLSCVQFPSALRAIELVNVATGAVTRPRSVVPPYDAFIYAPWPGRGSYLFPLVTLGAQPGNGGDLEAVAPSIERCYWRSNTIL